MREFSALPVLVGTVLGMVFGASSLYLVLKVGLTVSASIPVAVIAITLFRILSRFGLRASTILENNIVQTAGSAGESIAFGVGVTMPAILILGFDLEVTRVTLVAVLGGLLGILMMIPLRRALIVQQHGILKYPEGTACAEVLKAGASAESRATAQAGAGLPHGQASAASDHRGAYIIFFGFAIGLAYKTLMTAFKAWKEIPQKIFGSSFAGASVGAEISPELLGVGYIIGPRLAAIMCAGGVLAYLVLIPAIRFFGAGLEQVLPPGSMLIRDMGPDDIRGAYVLYIGAGAVAAGGIISVLRSLPVIWQGIQGGLAAVRAARRGGHAPLRTDQDLPLGAVLAGIAGLVVMITLAPPLHMNLVGAILIVSFGFLFATVSSRLTGEIGSSSNPISGMTVATLLLTCLCFWKLEWTQPAYYLTALSVGGIVCIAASNAGTTSQDLKTGFLVGATPRLQQISILIGALGSALILGPILLRLNQESTVYVPRITLERIESPLTAAGPYSTAPWPDAWRSIAMPEGGPFQWLPLASAVAGADGSPLLPAGDYLVGTNSAILWRVREHFPASLRAPPSEWGSRESLLGRQGAADPAQYHVWHNTSPQAGPTGRYLVDASGTPIYLVDPGINGVYSRRPDGSTVSKFQAPKAVLMSYIIKGILSQELPWALVLLGVMIAVVLEMSGIPSLAFAVGVYLPLSSSAPIFVGGLVRLLVDRYLARKHAAAKMTPEQLAAEGDRSPGVLLASGYIAGGAIAGILIAFLAGFLGFFIDAMTSLSERWNPLYAGSHSDLLALLPFTVLVILLLLTGREAIFRRS